MSIDTPILLLIFNRADTTQKVFDQLKKLKPKQLFVAADGPRKNKEGETLKCQQVRDIFKTQIDWDCELHTLYRNQNLGCRIAVSSAISWFFETVEAGIILEDDCVPDLSFFPFCTELLERYKDNHAVYQISGFNYLGEFNDQTSYFTSRMAFIWGWATWRRAWEKMDIDMKTFPHVKQSQKYKELVNDRYAQLYMLKKWEATYLKKNDSWAYAWAFSVFVNNGVCIIPKYNLIQNAGFSELSTNTKRGTYYQQTKSYEMPFPLSSPSSLVEIDPNRERVLFYAAHKSKWLLRVRYYLPKKILTILNNMLGR